MWRATPQFTELKSAIITPGIEILLIGGHTTKALDFFTNYHFNRDLPIYAGKEICQAMGFYIIVPYIL